MNLGNTIIFSLSTGFLLIALYQSMKFGFFSAYWLYMISIGLFLWFKMRKDAAKRKEAEE